MAYPFGFDPDYRSFYFRSIFLPIALLVAGVVVAGYGRDLSNRSKWYLALIAAFLTTLPAFYDFEVAPGFSVPSHWGLVDNFLGGMAALAAGASVRSIARQSTGWLIAAALVSSFCLLIKPSGAFVMAFVGLVWLGLAMLRLRSASPYPETRSRMLRWIVRGAIIFAVTDLIVLAASFSSSYLSRGNLEFGNAAIVVMRSDLRLTWRAFQGMVHTGLGYALVAWLVLTALLVVRHLRRLRADSSAPWNRQMLCALALASCVTLAFGVWFWLFGTGGVYQVRYFIPFALMALIFAVPVMIRSIPAMSRWEVIVLSIPMAAAIVNMGLLLAQREPSIEWQKWAGVNLSSRSKDAVAAQAQSFINAIKRDGRDVVLYSMPQNVTDSEFQAVINYTQIANPPVPTVSIHRPVDWHRPSAYRINEMLGSDYWLFEPMRDRDMINVTLATPAIDQFYLERPVFQAWATDLTESDGVAVFSETPRARVLRITDPERLALALDKLIEGRAWRPAFYAVNPKRRWKRKESCQRIGAQSSVAGKYPFWRPDRIARAFCEPDSRGDDRAYLVEADACHEGE
jgi:hypothetical protein